MTIRYVNLMLLEKAEALEPKFSIIVCLLDSLALWSRKVRRAMQPHFQLQQILKQRFRIHKIMTSNGFGSDAPAIIGSVEPLGTPYPSTAYHVISGSELQTLSLRLLARSCTDINFPTRKVDRNVARSAIIRARIMRK
jgi:hypothetical protein